MNIDPQLLAEGAAWVWNEFKPLANSLWRRFQFPEAKQKYQNRVKELYSTMRVLDKLETVFLNDHYVDLFVLEEPEAYRRYGIGQLESSFDEVAGFYHRGNRSEALLVTKEYNRLFVLGKPGAGKTTFLKYLASLAAEEKIDKVPIFVSFNSWAYSEKNLFDYIVEQFDICSFPDAERFVELLLEKGKALILFDGLDEVSEEGSQRGKMIHELENLVKKHQDNKYIITCRNAANDYKFDGFIYVEIADLTDFQVSIFVKKWFDENPSKAPEFLRELAKEEHQSLKELSHNPLLLGMLCFVFEVTSSFPPKRGMVYREAIDALTKRWDKERGVQRDKILGFSPQSEKKLLTYLAYEYFLENKIFFEQGDIEKKIEKHFRILSGINVESEDILAAIEIQHGLLAQRARRVYTFSHLTFQEYFTAQYILDQLDTKRSLLDDLFTRLNNQRWRDVFPLIAGLIPTPDIFFEKFIVQIREPIKKDKVLTRNIKNIDVFSETLQGSGDIIAARMRAMALTTSAGRIIHIIQNVANKRASRMARRVLSLLNMDESIINLSKAQEIAEIISMGLTGQGKNRDKINKIIKLAAKHADQTDFDMDTTYQSSTVDLDKIRLTLREQLKIADETLIQDTRTNIQYTLEKNLVIDTSLRITLDFKPNIIGEFVAKIKELEFPKTFATKEEWNIFKKNILQSIFPVFWGEMLELKEEHLSVLEQFIKGNIFLLDCLQQAEATDYLDCVFTINHLPVQGK